MFFQVDIHVQTSQFATEAAQNTTLFAWENFLDEQIRRQFKKLSLVGTAKLSNDKLKQVSTHSSWLCELKSIYNFN